MLKQAMGAMIVASVISSPIIFLAVYLFMNSA
ncbi:hypothetical protein SAMN05444141_101605 [Pseudovibrio denitrificans]|uniref:Uncharacterized protein n=1 Tax=Pseudovibrio denitrificans TaxID=258256 RepID=A0A1I6Y2I4_9HYPH|nr:hypothetical protein PsWM33_01982 [Pseudovibrio sp. WM33]SFT44748.1 hypothetical protein SAMN05444141_101605 [Pseudovibrio denitrificans]